MTDPINSELADAIQKHLPGMVGQQLQARLKQADEMERLVKFLKDNIADLEQTKRVLQDGENAAKIVLGREAKLRVDEREMREREHALTVREAVIKTIDDMSKQMVANNQQVLLAVFANHQFKYNVVDSASKGTLFQASPGTYPQQQTLNDSRSIHGSGDGAPAPLPQP